MDRRAMWLVALVSMSVLTVACSGSAGAGSGPGSDTPPSGTPTGSTASQAPEVPEVLDFEAPLLGGGTFRGAHLAGKDVAFWFWAPW